MTSFINEHLPPEDDGTATGVRKKPRISQKYGSFFILFIFNNALHLHFFFLFCRMQRIYKNVKVRALSKYIHEKVLYSCEAGWLSG